MASSKEEKEAMAGEAVEKHTPAKAAGGKLILFNQSKNPYHLKPGPNGEKRLFAVGTQIEALDQAEYDFLRNYKGVGTTAQVAPSLQNVISKLESDKAALEAEVADLRAYKEKFDKKGK